MIVNDKLLQKNYQYKLLISPSFFMIQTIEQTISSLIKYFDKTINNERVCPTRRIQKQRRIKALDFRLRIK